MNCGMWTFHGAVPMQEDGGSGYLCQKQSVSNWGRGRVVQRRKGVSRKTLTNQCIRLRAASCIIECDKK